MTDDQIRREIWKGKWAAYGHEPTDQDYAYWVPLWPALVARGVEINRPNYAMDRLIGWTSGEPIADADRALYGDYAVPPSPFHDVPPYPGDEVTPVPVPVPPPIVPSVDIVAELAAIKAMLQALSEKPAPNYQGSGTIPYLGHVTFNLVPK